MLRALYFGIPDYHYSSCISGESLVSLVGSESDKYTNFCYSCNPSTHFINVTEQFFEKYIEIGRCIYDKHCWLEDEENRYTYIDDTHRKCNWCGVVQHKEIIVHSYNTEEWLDG